MEPEQTPTPTPVSTLTSPSAVAASSKLYSIIAVCIAVAGLIIGGAVFAYESNQQSVDIQSLQDSVTSLKSQLASLQTPVPTVAPTVAPSASPSASASASASPSASATASTAIAACATKNLSLALVNNGGGTAGTTYLNAAVTNKGTATCTLTGYPTVTLLNSAGTSEGKAINSATVASSAITLAAGKTAYAAIGFPTAGNFPTGTCNTATTTLSLTPPNTTTALTVATTYAYCPGFSVTAFSATKL